MHDNDIFIIDEIMLKKIKELNESGAMAGRNYIIKIGNRHYFVDLEFKGTWVWHIRYVHEVIEVGEDNGEQKR